MTKAIAKTQAIAPITIAFDPTAVDRTLAEATELLNDLGEATIDNDKELAEFAEHLRGVVRQKDAAETIRAAMLKPVKETTATINALLKPAIDTWAACETRLKRLIGDYQLAKEAERRKQLAAAAEAAQARNPEALTTALVAAQDAAPTKIEGVGVRAKWVARIASPALVPYEWCTPDVKRIEKLARETPPDQQPTPIPGVVYELDATVSALR
jgi:hypothetical protein